MNFSLFSRLKSNNSKCEIAGTGTLKGVRSAVCNIKNINFNNECIKILGIILFIWQGKQPNIKQAILNKFSLSKIVKIYLSKTFVFCFSFCFFNGKPKSNLLNNNNSIKN